MILTAKQVTELLCITTEELELLVFKEFLHPVVPKHSTRFLKFDSKELDQMDGYTEYIKNQLLASELEREWR